MRLMRAAAWPDACFIALLITTFGLPPTLVLHYRFSLTSAFHFHSFIF